MRARSAWGACNDVDAEQLTHAGSSLFASLGSSLDSAHLAGNDHGGQTGTDGVGTNELNVSSLQHCIGSVDVANQTLRLDKTQSFHKLFLLSEH